MATEPSTGSTPRSTLVGLIVALVVAGSLSSGRLVDMAARLPFGDNRDRWLSAAEALDDGSSSIGADRPADALAEFLDRPRPGMGAATNADTTPLVVGELATEPPLAGTAAPSPTTAQTLTTTTLSTAEGESATTTSPTSTTTSSPAAPPVRELRTISSDEPLRVWMGGDSLGEYVATAFLGGTADRDLTSITYDYNIATGLARPDQFDWFERLSLLMASDNAPEAIVWMVGGNDNQDMIDPDGVELEYPTEAWQAEYRRRVGTMMDIAANPDVQLIWIGLPPMRANEWVELPAITNAILESEAAERSWVTYIDIWDLFLDEGGNYNPRITGPDGRDRTARAPDGVHITRAGSVWVADLVWDEIAEVWGLPAAAE